MSALCVGMGLGGALDLEAAAAANQDYLSTRTSERQEMIILNDRLAVYIEKVRQRGVHSLHLPFSIEHLSNKITMFICRCALWSNKTNCSRLRLKH